MDICSPTSEGHVILQDCCSVNPSSSTQASNFPWICLCILVDAFLGLHLLLRGLQGLGPLNVHRPMVRESEQQVLKALLDLGLGPHVEVEPGLPRGGSCWVLGPRGRTCSRPKRWLLGRRECSIQRHPKPNVCRG